MKIRLLALILVATFFSAAPPLLAGPLTIANAGFETPSLSDNAFTVGNIPGWTIISSGVAGVFNPPISQFPAEAPEGQNVAYSQGPTFSQVLSYVLAANTTYTLQVDVGSPLTQSFPGYVVQLRAGGVTLVEDNGSLTPALGTFATSTITFSALAGNPNIGQALEIAISSNGPETDFDNVRLVATPAAPVPEPATLWFLLIGAVAVFGAARYQHQRLGEGRYPPV